MKYDPRVEVDVGEHHSVGVAQRLVELEIHEAAERHLVVELPRDGAAGRRVRRIRVAPEVADRLDGPGDPPLRRCADDPHDDGVPVDDVDDRSPHGRIVVARQRAGRESDTDQEKKRET